MQVSNPRIVFMGTPEFAVASLDAIIKAGFTVTGVVTSPDKPSGRGLQLHSSPVKEFALKNDIPVFQPLKLKDPEFLNELKSLKPDIQVVVAFRMLPVEVWSLPTLGTFNLHASLLPQYRGAAPINWAVINGESKTGVTTFFINHEIDKGSIIYSRETGIGENETAGDVHDRLMEIGAELVVKTIKDISAGSIVTIDQGSINQNESLKAAPKIFRDDCRINWNNEIQKLHNFIRGLSPYPTAWTELTSESGETLTVKIFQAVPLHEEHRHIPGSIVSDGRNFLKVAGKDGYMKIERIQLQAKKQMKINEFLRGFAVTESNRFI